MGFHVRTKARVGDVSQAFIKSGEREAPSSSDRQKSGSRLKTYWGLLCCAELTIGDVFIAREKGAKTHGQTWR